MLSGSVGVSATTATEETVLPNGESSLLLVTVSASVTDLFVKCHLKLHVDITLLEYPGCSCVILRLIAMSTCRAVRNIPSYVQSNLLK